MPDTRKTKRASAHVIDVLTRVMELIRQRLQDLSGHIIVILE